MEPFATAAFRQRLTTGLLARYAIVNDSVADPGLGGRGGGGQAGWPTVQKREDRHEGRLDVLLWVLKFDVVNPE